MIARLAWLGVFVAPVVASAQVPTVSVVPTVANGNVLWAVSITPNVKAFEPGTSLAVELDFEFTHDIASATLNVSFWNVNGANTGNNPFTGTVTEGLVLDTATDTLFVSAGSELYTTATPMLLMTVETLGTIGYFSWGGRTALPGTPQAYPTSRIAQNGINYDGLSGACACIDFIGGDFDGSGSVGNGDLTLLLDNWGETVPPVPASWIGFQPTAPGIGNDELTALLDGWGDALGGIENNAAAVPEPATLLLAAFAFVGATVNRRRPQ